MLVAADSVMVVFHEFNEVSCGLFSEFDRFRRRPEAQMTLWASAVAYVNYNRRRPRADYS